MQMNGLIESSSWVQINPYTCSAEVLLFLAFDKYCCAFIEMQNVIS